MFLPRIDIKLQIGDISLGYRSPNSHREYRFELRTHPITTPQESFLLLFFKKEEKITPHKLILKKFKKAIDKIFRESYNIRVVKIFGGGK